MDSFSSHPTCHLIAAVNSIAQRIRTSFGVFHARNQVKLFATGNFNALGTSFALERQGWFASLSEQLVRAPFAESLALNRDPRCALLSNGFSCWMTFARRAEPDAHARRALTRPLPVTGTPSQVSSDVAVGVPFATSRARRTVSLVGSLGHIQPVLVVQVLGARCPAGTN